MLKKIMTMAALIVATSSPAMAIGLDRIDAAEASTGLELHARRPPPPPPPRHRPPPPRAVAPIVAATVVVCLTIIILTDMTHTHKHHQPQGQ